MLLKLNVMMHKLFISSKSSLNSIILMQDYFIIIIFFYLFNNLFQRDEPSIGTKY